MAHLMAVPDGDAVYPVQDVYSGGVRPVVNPAAMFLAELGESSRPTVRSRLDIIANLLEPGSDSTTLDWSSVTIQETTQLRSRLVAEKYLWTTCNAYLGALKGCLRMAYLSGLMGADQYHRAISVRRFRGTTIPAGRHIEDSEARDFLAMVAEERTPRARRDLALFALAYSTGARREELATLEPGDVDLRARTITIRHGKMNRARVVKFSAWVAGPLAEWMRVRQAAVNLDAAGMGALFTKVHGTGAVAADAPRLSRAGMDNVLRFRVAMWVAKDPGTRKPWSWHDWRRTVAGRALDSGASVEDVQRHLGHATAVQTLAYVRERKGLAQTQAVADMMPSPF